MHCGHAVTAEFRWTQIVSPDLVVSTAPMGVTTPCVCSTIYGTVWLRQMDLTLSTHALYTHVSLGLTTV